jgi:capsular exopolysaccharide synthesis family protein
MRYFDLKAELESIDHRLKSHREERGALASEIARYEHRVRTSPQHEMALGQLSRDSANTRTEYEALLAKQQEARLDQQLHISKKGIIFKIAEPAELPSAPYSPKRPRIILLGFLASLGIGVMAVLFAEQTDTSFNTIEEVQAFTDLPVMSAIPTISARAPAVPVSRNGNHSSSRSSGGAATAGTTAGTTNDTVVAAARPDVQKHRIAVLSHPQSVPSEQYGILALKTRQWMSQSGAQVLVVTSAASGEGKSLTAANLSLTLARSMEGRVLLLDGDLRRSHVHECLNIKQDVGFSDLLLKPQDDINRYVSKVGNLYVMPAGAQVSNPVGLLASQRTAEVLARLRKEFRFIVMDTPPIVPVADTHILAGLADGVVIVVRARQTQRELFQRAIESLSATNAIGVVLNDVQFGDTRYAYAYHYQQRNGLGSR